MIDLKLMERTDDEESLHWLSPSLKCSSKNISQENLLSWSAQYVSNIY